VIGCGGCLRSALAGAVLLLACPTLAFAQEPPVPALRVGSGAETIEVDGQLNEAAWRSAPMSDAFAQTDPGEGLPPTFRTTLRVLAGRNALVIGIVCDDPEPSGIVSYSVRRDAGLGQEDSLKIVLGPFRDGRSGYVFSVNPRGARYDAVINAGAENENADWDGIWQAATGRNETGWTAEIRIPIQTLSFNPSVREWHFNVERRIQRLLEIDRWASAVRQYRLTLTSRAGLITDLPDFALGRGLSVRPSLTAGGGVPAPSASLDGKFHPSLDVTQRLGANVTASFTTNTDFAETEVDTRQTNLTRFPLFFPEKRTFFLEGIDIFQFGPGVNNDMIPYFSRRMGLVAGREVPIIAGGKVNGRVAGTNFAAVLTTTDSQPGVIDEGATTGVVRIKRNLWRESYVGFLATAGDPLGRSGSWLSGVDFTYSTSSFLGDKNFSVNAYGVMMGREGLGNDRTATAFKVDYPNDKWDLRLWYRRIGRDFDPSLGFVPRRAMQRWNPAISNRTRFARGPIQDMSMGINPYITYSLHGQYEGLESPLTIVNWRFRSGERVQFIVTPTADRPRQPFEVSEGVVIAPALYQWVRRNVGFTTAQKRRLYGSLNWTTGSFYDGDLSQWDLTLVWNPTPLYTLEFTGERNDGQLPLGAFTQHLVGTRVRINVSSDFSIATYAQYDTDSDSVGINSRLRWTFLPVADLFVVYNHNVRSLLDRWQLDSNQLLVKIQYAWRM
jgi:Domain of unknown function (DUF5916)